MIHDRVRRPRQHFLMRVSVLIAAGLWTLFVACTTPGGPGDPDCTSDTDCAADEVCSAAGECVPDDTGTNGEPECTSDADCAAEEFCSPAGTCEPDDDPPVDPRDCDTNSDCSAGEVCTPEGLCVPEAGELPCASNADCAADEVCTPAGFCADADDPDPPGSGGGGVGGGGGGGGGGSGGGGGGGGGGGDPVPTCTVNEDCAEDEICQGGLCAPDPQEPNFAAELAGCWRMTFSATGQSPATAIYEFDDQGRLTRTWGVDTVSGRTVEEVRYTVPNATFFNGLYALTEQIVSLDSTRTQLSVTAGLIYYDFRSNFGDCLILRSTVCTDLSLIEATLSGTPPNTLVSGTLVGSLSCVSTVTPANNVEGIYDATVSGEKLATCPDITLANVESQEERGDLCP